MTVFSARFQVPYEFPIHFTQGIFSPANPLLPQILTAGNEPLRILAVFDRALVAAQPQLIQSAGQRCGAIAETFLPILLTGGEAVKNNPAVLEELYDTIDRLGLSRHSYIFAVGGGALLDAVGFVAATAHRGIRLLRFPSTTLSQADGGMGVKNAVNFRRKKNFVGTFAPPFAVINDFDLLETLSERDWRAGLVEAVKVALIKDAGFFDRIEALALPLARLDRPAFHGVIQRCAELHAHHICGGGDPFEFGSSRPLDFGHWAAHKLELLSEFRLRHGEAVAIGIAIDTEYSLRKGLCDAEDRRRIFALLGALGFEIALPEMRSIKDHLLGGLEEFRQHLGGRLTITMLRQIGVGLDVHEIDRTVMGEAIQKVCGSGV